MSFVLQFNNTIKIAATDANLAQITLVQFAQETKDLRFVVRSSGTGPKAGIIVIDHDEMKKLIDGKSETEILDFLNQKTGKNFVHGNKNGIYVAQ
ncbi:MAG: hypothetical protein RIQ54_96 [Candidatus Parcubacteria bacterium]|jgi:hypothetical protein